jgi:hexosaminidase
MAYPRASALAEVLWTLPESRDFKDFAVRLEVLLTRLAMLGVQFRKPGIGSDHDAEGDGAAHE